MTTILDLPLGRIDTGADRPRDLDAGLARGLADSIAIQGLICPIIVRMVGHGYRLVDGRHRHEAFRILGRETIPAIVSDQESDDAAMLDAVMANVARRMSALDFCQHMFVLKGVWLRLHPETANGGHKNVLKGRGIENIDVSARSRKPASGEGEPEVTSFVGAMAEQFDLGRTQIKEAVAIWKGLTAASRATLRGTALADRKTELKALSKESRDRQAQILELILDPAHPDIRSVAEALHHLDHGVTPDVFERRFSVAVKRLPDVIIADTIALQREYRCLLWFIESVQFQEFLRTTLMSEAARAGVGISAVPVVPTADKNLRIARLQPPVRAGLIRFSADHTTLIDQLQQWPNGDHDDGPDCLDMLWQETLRYAGGGATGQMMTATTQAEDRLGGYRLGGR